MADNEEALIDVAKAYAFQLQKGRSQEQAGAYIKRRFPWASDADLGQAASDANRAIRIGEVMATLPETAKLSEALEGERVNNNRVAVRVTVTRTLSGGRTRQNTLYLDMAWDQTIQDVQEEVDAWVRDTDGQSGQAEAWVYDFQGPSRWPLIGA